jgi:uncharacterized membrane protein
MRTKEFIGRLEHGQIVDAIRAAEENSSGEIRVFIQRGKLNRDVVAVAEQQFQRLKMHETQDRNGVLIFVAPREHQFAVIGDEGIHQKCGDELWQKVVAKMSDHFRAQRFSRAIVDAIRDVGEVLAKYFPKRGGDSNELPDAVVER